MRINEIFVQGDKKTQEHDTVIGYKQWVWVLNDENYDNLAPDIFLKLQITDDKQDMLDYPMELAQFVSDEYNQAVVGTIDGFGDLVIQADNYRPSTDSKTLQKIMKALHIDEVVINHFDYDIEDDVSFREDRTQFALPLKKKTFFHGTSLRAWQSGINRTGIRAMGKNTNFDRIRHDDKVFITLNKEKALFHASTASDKTDSAGIILDLRIPNVDYLVMDYDVAISNYGKDHKRTIALGYSEIHDVAQNGYAGFAMSDAVNPDLKDIRNSGKESLSSKLGIFGYLGRIPVKFIDGVWVDDQSLVSSIANERFDIEEKIRGEPLPRWDYYTVSQFNDRISDIEDDLDGEQEEYE